MGASLREQPIPNLIWVGSESANAADCKSVLYEVVGSTPTLPTKADFMPATQQIQLRQLYLGFYWLAVLSRYSSVGRTLVWGTRGRRFKSCYFDHRGQRGNQYRYSGVNPAQYFRWFQNWDNKTANRPPPLQGELPSSPIGRRLSGKVEPEINEILLLRSLRVELVKPDEISTLWEETASSPGSKLEKRSTRNRWRAGVHSKQDGRKCQANPVIRRVLIQCAQLEKRYYAKRPHLFGFNLVHYPNWQRRTAQTRFSFGSNPK